MPDRFGETKTLLEEKAFLPRQTLRGLISACAAFAHEGDASLVFVSFRKGNAEGSVVRSFRIRRVRGWLCLMPYSVVAFATD